MPCGTCHSRRRVRRLEPRTNGIQRRLILRLQREPGQSGAVRIARSCAVAVPDVGADVMVIAARGHERRSAAPPCQIEAHYAAVELLGLLDVADA